MTFQPFYQAFTKFFQQTSPSFCDHIITVWISFFITRSTTPRRWPFSPPVPTPLTIYPISLLPLSPPSRLHHSAAVGSLAPYQSLKVLLTLLAYEEAENCVTIGIHMVSEFTVGHCHNISRLPYSLAENRSFPYGKKWGLYILERWQELFGEQIALVKAADLLWTFHALSKALFKQPNTDGK